MSVIVGVDPGLSGAISVMENGNFRGVYDVPVAKQKSGKSTVNPRALYKLLSDIRCQDKPDLAVLENVHAMPGQGVTSMWTMGHTCGVIRGLLEIVFTDVILIRPQDWKRHFKLSADKSSSLEYIRTRYKDDPYALSHLTRKKDHNRAEAIAIALYALEHKLDML